MDDDESVCRALTRLLRCSGIYVRRFGSAEAFLGSLGNGATAHELDCALIDVQMPGTSGLALHRELLRRGSHLPVIFMTAHDSEEVRAEALGQGATAYLLKPLAEHVVLDAIHEAVAPKLRSLEATSIRP